MKLFLILCFALLLNASSLKPVSYVDIKGFSGLWYEIARTYNSFEKDCVAATVEYILVDNEEYDVKNRCFKNVIGGERILYNGTATPQNDLNMAELTMVYFWIFRKDYKVVYLDEGYTTAIVTDDELENVWIMHREPFLDENRLKELVSLLGEHMDVNRLIYTPQDKEGRYK